MSGEKKLWYSYTEEYYTAERRKGFLPFATAWMELEKIMLIMPVGERQIPHALTYKWHLMNKTNK